ncbi:anoctamin-7 isoform X3 [Dasypus novemcinctus]|uniref:anoctamin-7 isoform X3 n=1 Tax=Dasypus novemcinctus TaxID=9361 RepID=UPI00265EB22D|nr:anoctamin-7 isoform X3 [Dasypus novemcinctus]
MLQDKHPPTSEAEHNCLSCSAPRAVWLGRAQGRGPLSSQLPTTSVRKQGAVGLLRLRPPPGSNTQGFWVKAGHVAMSSRVRGGRSSRVQRRGDAGLPSSPWPPRGFPRVWSPRGSSGRTRHPCLSVGPGAARGGSSSSAGEHPPRRPAPPQPTHSPWWGPLCGGDRGGKCQKGWGCREPACQGGWDLCTPPMHALRGRSACVCSRVCTCLPRVHLPPACAPASRLCTCLPRVHLPPACAPASRLCTCLPPVHLPPACAPASHVCTSVFSSLPCVPPGASPRVLLCAHLSPTRRFLGSDNQDTFFTSTQRHQILFEILAKTPYGHEKKGLFGIDQLLAQGVFSAAFPLHDGPFEVPAGGLPPQSLNQRQVLRQHWARWAKWCKYQPLDHVRRYFGEKVALYFAWLGFYTGWLLPAAVLGTLVFIGGSLAASSDTPTQELCNSTDRFEMCPLCFDCPFWLLSSACTLVQAGRLFDHGGTVFFSTCMALWAVLLLEYWKRTRATLAYRWDCSDYEDMEERPRPQFAASAPTTAVNPITGEEEPHFPPRSRARRMLAGSVVILMMVAVVIMCLLSVILYRAIMAVLVSRSENAVLAAWASRIASLTGSVVNLVAILILSRVYVGLARVLTRWEMHRTQTAFEDAFTLKVFVFQFVNFYSSPIYVAFFKGRFVGYPGNYHTLFGVRSEECAAGGCLMELAQELLVIMVGKQAINNVQEILVPKLKGWWQKWRLRPRRRAAGGRAPWEADYQLLPCEGLFEEYLEMVLQFGFVTVFVAACPLAPLFALLNNWAELRLDARKFVCEYRRPVAARAQDIGIWFRVLEAITHLAVVSNAFLLAFASDFLPRAYYRWTRARDLRGFVDFTLARAPPAFAAAHNRTCRYRAFRDDDGHYSQTYWTLLAIRLAFVIVFEHVVFSVGRVLDLLVPDVPESVEIKVKREYYLAKQALAENEPLFGTDGAKDGRPLGPEASPGPQA